MKNPFHNVEDWHPGQLAVVLVGLFLIGILAPDIGYELLGADEEAFGAFVWVVVLAIGLFVGWKWFGGRKSRP